MYKVVGTIGALLVLFGFTRITSGKWNGKSKIYELDNLLGASLLAVYQFHYKVYITMVLNLIWAAVALRGLNSYRQRRKHR
jgi:hypothetical protein